MLGIEGVERSITWGCGDVGRRGWVSLVGMVGMVGWQDWDGGDNKPTGRGVVWRCKRQKKAIY